MSDFFTNDAALFITGSVLLAASILMHAAQKERYAIALLQLSSFFFFLFAAVLYPHLHVWDERFHALAAKNLMEHPFVPTLYDEPVVSWTYDRWDRYHIWLHKQPLFLWQMALSYKMFGVSELAARLPSVALSVMCVYAGWRSGKLLGNTRTGYYTALFFATSFYIYELVAGWQMLDHNDHSFMAYVTLSLWAWIEYMRSGKVGWVILIGLFSGFAILVKWLVGLLVYFGWGLYMLHAHKLKLKKYGHITLAFLVTAAVALPWQIYIFHAFPEEARASYDFNVNHFFHPLDGHEGPYYYHFTMIDDLYGLLVPLLLVPAFIVFYRRTEYRKVCIAFAANILVVYIFFAFAQTRMPSFTFVVALPVFITMAFLVDVVVSWIERSAFAVMLKRSIVFVIVLAIAFMRIDISALHEKHKFLGERELCFQFLEENKNIFESLELPGNAVLFNVNGRHYVEAMFYTDRIAYNFIPSAEQYGEVRSKGKVAAVFQSPNDTLPAYLKNDPSVIVISEQLHLCE